MKTTHKLTTVYSETMDKSVPWQDYPRPTLRRDSYVCLNGLWDFAYSKSAPVEYTEKILVPFPPESELSGINRTHKKSEKLYYRRTFSLPDGFIKSNLLLHFGAVDQCCEVFVNGRRVGTHEGGYIPFSFEIKNFVCDGENEIAVVATDTLSKLYPYGKQRRKRGGMWYTEVSGIWQTVWLESLPQNAIEALKINTNTECATVEVKTCASSVRLTLCDSGEVFTSNDGVFRISPKDKRLWTPKSPYLYRFTLETDTDRIESYFALREIGTETVNGVPRLTLNGKPYLFNGLLDQGYFPDGIFLPATSAAYENDIKQTKALGFNTLRKHIKIEPEIFYYLCDKLGIAVFQDMINNSDYSFIRDTAIPTVLTKRRSDKNLHKNPVSRRIFKETLEKTVELLHNHPSVLYYTVFNEGWGQFLADEAYKKAKELDSARIIDATSGWFWQKESDVDSHHSYFKRLNIPLPSERPVVLSEFGGYSYRCEGHLFGTKNYGYKTFKNRIDFENAVAALYENEVLPLVRDGVSAFIYTQISDVEDETNGFLTYDRKVIKVDTERFSKIMKKLYDIFGNTDDITSP